MEKTRHFLLLREKLGDSIPKSLSDSLSPSLSSGTLSTSTSISSQISTTTFESAVTPSESSGYDSADIESLVDREKELATKVWHRATILLAAGVPEGIVAQSKASQIAWGVSSSVRVSFEHLG